MGRHNASCREHRIARCAGRPSWGSQGLKSCVCLGPHCWGVRFMRVWLLHQGAMSHFSTLLHGPCNPTHSPPFPSSHAPHGVRHPGPPSPSSHAPHGVRHPEPPPPPVMHHMESDTLGPLPIQSCTTWTQDTLAPISPSPLLSATLPPTLSVSPPVWVGRTDVASRPA